MNFKQSHLKMEHNNQTIGIGCLVLTEPDSDDKVWIHLNQTPPIVAMPCLQYISTSDLVS
jgi:hypothetical protein